MSYRCLPPLAKSSRLYRRAPDRNAQEAESQPIFRFFVKAIKWVEKMSAPFSHTATQRAPARVRGYALRAAGSQQLRPRASGPRNR